MTGGLDVRLEAGLPETLPAAARTSVFLYGSCFHRELPVRRIEVHAGGRAEAARAIRMPRRDLYEALRGAGEEGDDPRGMSFRSGFWLDLPVEMGSEAQRVELVAVLSDGQRVSEPLGTIEPADRDGAPALELPPGAAPRVAVAMATFDPDPEMFRRQVESIRAQTVTDWVCFVSDDCSPPDKLREIEAVLEGDERFVLSRSPVRRGFYLNFERALRAIPDSIPFVALSDQDDRWFPEKLEALLEGIGDAQLVYSDQRVVTDSGEVLSETYWDSRRNNHTDLASLLVANTVTGAASLMRRELLDLALPFPRTPGTQYHDHWLALVALASGRIEYLDRPLYDYVQHDRAVLGHAVATSGGARPGPRLLLAWLRRGEWHRFASGWRAAYFFAYRRIVLLAEVLAARCGPGLRRGDRRVLRRIVGAERSPLGFGWLVARSLRPALGRNETLGAERILAEGIAWRHLVAASGLGRATPIRGLPYDASLPPAEGDGVRTLAVEHANTRNMANLIRPLRLSVVETAPARVNVLIPTVELKHFFGGYITKFNLARKLAQSGVRTRLVTTDPTPPLPSDWRRRVEAYAGLEGMFEEVEIAFGRDGDAPVEVSPDDTFVATTWWTAHIAHAALGSVRSDRFLYLIQEYEPFTHPMGSWAALSMSTYDFPHVAMFSTELLRKFFAARGYGVFAEGERAGRRHSISFQNAITRVRPPSAERMEQRSDRRLLFYARPEAHGARNMFELGLMGIAEAVRRGLFGPEWRFFGIGAVDSGDRIGIGSGRHLELLPRTDQASYGDMLAAHDLGVALMCTPHPSLVPLEMASAGMVTVTNSFETKTAAEMSALSANLITARPSLDGVVEALAEAVRRTESFADREAGAKVEWSRDWEESFSPQVMASVRELLAMCGPHGAAGGMGPSRVPELP